MNLTQDERLQEINKLQNDATSYFEEKGLPVDLMEFVDFSSGFEKYHSSLLKVTKTFETALNKGVNKKDTKNSAGQQDLQATIEKAMGLRK